MRAFVIFALIVVAAARPYVNIGGNDNYGTGGGYNSEVDTFDESEHGLIKGETQVIDISGGSAAGGVIYKPVIKQGPPRITKHFYVHEAPEEPINVRVEEKEINVRPQKHYKIIFIKAPSEGQSFASSNTAVFPQNEEKTIVYVLSKKPEGVLENGNFPAPPPAVTSKPEVFFVKYKTQQEAESAIATIQDSFKEGGLGFNSPEVFKNNLPNSSSGVATSFSQGSSDSGASQSFGGSKPGAAQAFVESASAGSFGDSSNGAIESSFQTMAEVPQRDSAFKTEHLTGGQ